MNPSNSPQRSPKGFGTKVFVILVCLISIIGFIGSVWSTHNFLFILGAIGTAFIGLLQIGFIHSWFLDDVIPFLERHGITVIRSIEQGAWKVWRLRNILLVFIILGFVIKDYTPFPAIVQNGLSSFCIQRQISLCGNGISVTSIGTQGSIAPNVRTAQTQSQNDGAFWLYFILVVGTILIMAILPFFTGYIGQKVYYRSKGSGGNGSDGEEYLDRLLDEAKKHYTFAKGQVVFSLTIGIIFLVVSFIILAPIAYHLSVLTNASLLLGTTGALMGAIATYSLALNIRGIKMMNKYERQINNIYVVRYAMLKILSDLDEEERRKEILRLIEILIEKK